MKEYLGFFVFLAFLGAVVLLQDMSPENLQKKPHSLGAAVLCRIGGPSFCPQRAP